MSKKKYIIPLFIPFLGCPHACSFCNQIKITNKDDDLKFEYKKIINEINKYLSFFPKNSKNIEIAFFGGSFTAIDQNLMLKYLEIAYFYKNKGIIHNIRLSTRPDAIDENKLYLLKKYNVDIIELGVQSTNNNILKLNNRGHNFEDVIRASKLIKDYNFILGHQIMPGLYRSNSKLDITTALDSIKLKPDIVRIYPTIVIKDTLLEKLMKLNIYIPYTLNEAIELCSEIYMIYTYNNIDVIRIGLQATENINFDMDVLGGPFHPSFRQLVESNIRKIFLENYILEHNIHNRKVSICTNNKEISYIVGNNAENKKYFYDKYKIIFKFIESDNTIIEVDNENIINIKDEIKMYIEEKYNI